MDLLHNNVNALLMIATGLATIWWRKAGARSADQFWGRPSRNVEQSLRVGELMYVFTGVVFVIFGVIQFFKN